MPTKEIKELRKAGKLDEAYTMAKAELEVEMSNALAKQNKRKEECKQLNLIYLELKADQPNIWCKRNLSWVLYDQLGIATSNLTDFLLKIKEVKELDLPEDEEMFWDNISIVIAKAVRNITGKESIDLTHMHQLFDAIKELPIKKKTNWYSVLFKAFHKGLKESYRYLEFADWWNFANFMPEDFEKSKMPDGKEVMALAEQGYTCYAKHLLPKQTPHGDTIFNKEKAEAFLPELSKIVEEYPKFQWPAYFNAKLLLALGDKDNMLKKFLPFAKKKRNDFWVWETFAEAFTNDPDKVFACYCKALSCGSPEEMLVSLRQKMARILISKNHCNEARTEIDLLVHAKTKKGSTIPAEVTNWQAQDWYKKASVNKSNVDFYKNFVPTAEALLYTDVQEEKIIVEFVNTDKKMLNFIASESKFGFLKYDRFLSKVNMGDVLRVRFEGGSKGAIYHLYTAIKVNDDDFKKQFIKEVSGKVKIPPGKSFGFIDDVFIHSSLIKKYNLSDGTQFKGQAMKSYNQEKMHWGWKLV
ncbi:MAG: hypothetical protein QM528_03380 [Phycisphaerales bacterium]|nr:hypothetical protein [Phycisphaerales bacterium]